MFKERILEKLTSWGVTYTVRGNEIQCACLHPDHEDKHPSFSINHITGLFNCLSCGFSGSFTRYLDEVMDEDTKRTMMYLGILRELKDGTEDTLESNTIIYPPNSNVAIETFRGLSAKTIQEAGVYYCNVGYYRGRIIFPMEAGFDARVFPLDNTPPNHPKIKYLRPSQFKVSQHMYICPAEVPTDTVIICEGVIDALSYKQLGYSAACNFGLSQCTPWKAGELYAAGYTKVINGFDNDPAGVAGWQRVKESFREYFEIAPANDIVRTLRGVQGMDINDYLIAQGAI